MASEEQENERQALEAIYSAEYRANTACPLTKFSILLQPSSDEAEKNWVSVRLCVEFPAEYPVDGSVPVLGLADVVGMNEKQVTELLERARACAAEQAGTPAVYAIAECVREWLVAHNEQPSDGSAYEEMMKRERNREKAESGEAVGAGSVYDRELDPSIKRKVTTSAAEVDEVTRRKRYGTPVTEETFMAWRVKFEAEVAAKAAEDAANGIIPEIWTQGAPRGLTGRQMFERSIATVAGEEAAIEGAAAAVKSGPDGEGEPGEEDDGEEWLPGDEDEDGEGDGEDEEEEEEGWIDDGDEK
jgi:hypothetical protein